MDPAAALWPGAVVGDDALTQAVIKLRKSLRDTARSPQYIETISKRGYRLNAHVERMGQGLPSVSARERDRAEPGRAHARSARRTTKIAALLVVLIAGGAAIYVLREHTGGVDIEAPFLEDTAERWMAFPTVTVKPFETVGDDRAETYLARGIEADLTTDLSRLSGLRVISAQTLPRIGSGSAGFTAPTARYVLSGSVQRASRSLRVNVRLIDSRSGQQLWAERYDRSSQDLVAVQEEIIGRLVLVLPVQVSEAERQQLARRYTRNLEAYDYFLRGKAAFLARQPTGNDAARRMYQKAIELDPAFARAYSGLALTHADDYRNQWTTDGQGALARAFELAHTALRMDPDLSEVYAVLAYVHAVRLQYDQAIKLARRAITLAPSYADGYAYMGAFYTMMGQPAKAIPLLRTALRLNPDAGFIYFIVLGRAYLFLGDIEQALINLREALARNPADLEAHAYMAATLVAAGDLPAARWEAEEIRALQPDFAVRQWLQTSPMTDARQKRRLISLLAKVDL